MLILKLHRLYNENDVEFICYSYEQLGLDANDKILLYLDPTYYKTFNNFDINGFNYDRFIDYLESITNKRNCKVILSNSDDFQDVLIKDTNINLPSILNVTVRNFTNTTKPVRDRVELLATNCAQFFK